VRIPDTLTSRLYRQAQGGRWSLPPAVFTEALEASVERTFAGRVPTAREVERYLTSLHLEDLALACACAVGHEAAWEHVIRELRPILYRSADALDPGGGARDLADSIYADLYGVEERDGQRRSLLRYFNGRSSLATWLRAVLAQRHVDRLRSGRRLEPLPEDETKMGTPVSRTSAPDPDRPRFLALIQHALTLAIAALATRDRLRLSCYYAQSLTLAETGRVLKEHEATASRQLARTRRLLREHVERYLETGAGLKPDQIAACFEAALADPGPLDLSRLMQDRKESKPDRSI
jgi:RNA polymerase sigma-70 factor, ECF subfamily